MAPQEYGRVPFQDGKLCRITSIANLIIKQCSLDSIYPRYPESLLPHMRKGIITCPDAYSGPQPGNSRFQAPAVHRFTSYRLLRICKCIASHTYHRITSLLAGFGQCFFAALQTELKIFVLSYNPIAASSSCSLHEMSRQLLLDIQLSWFILGSPLTSSNY